MSELKDYKTAQNNALVRVLNAVPDFPSLNVTLGKNETIENLEFTSISGYEQTPPLFTSLTVVPYGRPSPAILDTRVAFLPDTSFTLALINNLQNISYLRIIDPVLPDAPNFARLRMVNLAVNANGLSLYNYNNFKIFSDVDYTEVTTYRRTFEGIKDFYITDSTGEVLLSFVDIPLYGGGAYTLYVMGEYKDGKYNITTKLVQDM